MAHYPHHSPSHDPVIDLKKVIPPSWLKKPVQWLIQSNILPYSKTLPLVEALNKEAIPFRDVGLVPFSDDPLDLSELQGSVVIPYGSTTLVKKAARQNLGGLFFHPERFMTSVWRQERPDMLNADAEILSLEDAIKLTKDSTTCWFIKPNNDMKEFAGEIFQGKDFAAWAEKILNHDFVFDKTGLVVVAPVKEVYAEWRHFVVGGKVVTSSMYRTYGKTQAKRETDLEVLEIAQKMADLWLPETCVAMDIGVTEEGYKVVEFNCINCSGFYDHDLPLFASSLTQHCGSV